MLSFAKERRDVRRVLFSRDGNGGVQTMDVMKGMTKKEVLDMVSRWWDSRGTHLDDYGGIQLTFVEGESGKREV